MSKIIFSLGSNIGDRQFFIDMAIVKLTEQLKLLNLKRSTIIENKAMLLPGSPAEWDLNFYNLVISADINLQEFPPANILEISKEIEKELGRKDRGRWSPREIDIDILAIDNLSIRIKDMLHIPHKEMLNRQFCTDGFKEIEPDLFMKNSKLY